MLLDLYPLVPVGVLPDPPAPGPSDPSANWSGVAFGGENRHVIRQQTPEEQILIIEMKEAA